jgi:hypothetical protein
VAHLPVHKPVGVSLTNLMITSVLVILGAIIAIGAVVVLLVQLTHAPDGVEDETGFHGPKNPAASASRYYSARSKPSRSAKPFKAQIPAA